MLLRRSACLLFAAVSLMAADHVWIEAESPSTALPAGVPFETRGWGAVERMSGGKVLNLSIPEDQAAKVLGAGAVVGYDFTLAAAGEQQVWARIGYEWVRSSIDWRLDDGAWQTLPASAPTCDLMPIQTWNEIAWIQFGTAQLKAGAHRLELRFVPQTQQKDGKTIAARTLFFADCFVIAPHFRPNGWLKPDAPPSAADLAAAAQVFTLPAATAPQRATVQLDGNWRIARWDEAGAISEADRRLPPQALPADLEQLAWSAIAVPGDRNRKRPELEFCHRFLYRTTVEVPAGLAGRSFQLAFQNVSMLTAVFVNGVRCGGDQVIGTPWTCDVTAGIKPGARNDLVVAIKDRYYAIESTDQPLGVRNFFNLPDGMLANQGVSFRMDMPVVANGEVRTGIIQPVSLVASGPVLSSDVFAKPSVTKHRLDVELTLSNPTATVRQVQVANVVKPWSAQGLGAVALSLPSQTIAVPAGKSVDLTVGTGWPDAKLWWPDEPNLYTVVTTLSIDGQPVDVCETRFGFREWQWNSDRFVLNGVPWGLWADCGNGDPKVTHQTMIRLWGEGDKPRAKILAECDEQGMNVRSSGIFDGEMASYGLSKDGKPHTVLFDNWKAQLGHWIRNERNHPSIFIWSVENEITYINSLNLGQAKTVEPEIRKGAVLVEALDPTRPTMVDGGRALMDGSMPVNGCHYNDLAQNAWRDYPDAAYTQTQWFASLERGAWPMIKDRPIFHGECYYAAGIAPGSFSVIGGDRCFIGPVETYPARGLYAKMLSEGWRWSGVAAWQFWMAETGIAYNSWKPVAALVREWNSTFAAGAIVERTVKVFNSTRFAGPITVGWTLTVGGKQVTAGSKDFTIAPGMADTFTIPLTMPKATALRTTGEFIITCSRNGAEVFREVKPLTVIAGDAVKLPQLPAGALVVIDPSGTVKAHLAARKIAFVEASADQPLPAGAKVVVLGTDALTKGQAADGRWLAFAAAGGRVLALEQANPLTGGAIPADLEPTSYVGRIGFPEDLSHPTMQGLDTSDFFCWSGDHVVYRGAYKKATKGAKSLVQCDEELGFTALAECQVEDGIELLSQLAIGTKLATDPVAQRVFDNLLTYVATYHAVRKQTAVVVDAASPMGRLLAGIGLKSQTVADPLAALQPPFGIAVIAATPANLAALVTHEDQVRRFTAGGGWIMFTGLTAEGLADYNRIVGVEHVIRPFRMEKVLLATPRDPLTSGLTLRDVVMDSGREIFNFMSLKFPAEDEFTAIVDYDEIGTFAKFPTPEEMGKPPGVAQPGWDHWPENLVNGYTADDTWRFCYMMALDRGDKTRWTLELPRAEELTSFSLVPSVLYHKITKMNFYFDEDPVPFTITVKPVHEKQSFPITGKRAKKVTIEIAEWEKSGTQNVLGIDNLWLGVKRSDEFLATVKPLLNIGGLVRYAKRPGGFLLNQLNIVEREVNPVNSEKKATIMKALLKNLGATFAGSDGLVVATLKTTPVLIQDGVFNAYTTAGRKPAWFTAGSSQDLAGLPAGDQRLAGVTYHINDFKTSPVPGAVMLAGHGSQVTAKEVTGIAINRTADALFFLHTLQPTDKATKLPADQHPVIFHYVVHYGDGSTAEIPVTWNRGIGPWLMGEPVSLAEAAVAWSAAFPSDKSRNAVLYGFAWKNPKPQLAITSIDLGYVKGGEAFGTPALLAITTAAAQ